MRRARSPFRSFVRSFVLSLSPFLSLVLSLPFSPSLSRPLSPPFSFLLSTVGQQHQHQRHSHSLLLHARLDKTTAENPRRPFRTMMMRSAGCYALSLFLSLSAPCGPPFFPFFLPFPRPRSFYSPFHLRGRRLPVDGCDDGGDDGDDDDCSRADTAFYLVPRHVQEHRTEHRGDTFQTSGRTPWL